MKKIKVITDNKEEIEAFVIAYVTLKSNNKTYLIYTKNKEDGKGNVEVYVSEVVRNENNICIVKGIEDEAAWSEVQKALSDISNNN